MTITENDKETYWDREKEKRKEEIIQSIYEGLKRK